MNKQCTNLNVLRCKILFVVNSSGFECESILILLDSHLKLDAQNNTKS